MSAQRNPRSPSSGTRPQPPDQTSPKTARTGQRSNQSDADWAETQGEIGGQPANRIGSPTADARGTNRGNTMPRTNDQGGSRANQQQDPEHPERPADGGQAEMQSAGERKRHPERRREES